MAIFERRRRVGPGVEPGVGPGARPAVPPRVAPPTRLGAEVGGGPRSAELLGALARLDQVGDEVGRAELAEWIAGLHQAEYRPLPLGFVAVCHLGSPYVDHILALDHHIVEHYPPHQAMPKPYDAARMLARSGAYLFVEVYDNGLVVPVRADGTIVAPR